MEYKIGLSPLAEAQSKQVMDKTKASTINVVYKYMHNIHN